MSKYDFQVERSNDSEMSSAIREFYSGSTILITGGTGFLGKLIVEKILRTCQNIERIYLIMRDKNGQNAEERMETYFGEEVTVAFRSDGFYSRDF